MCLLACLFCYLLPFCYKFLNCFNELATKALSHTFVQGIVAWALCSDIQSLVMLHRFVWFLLLECMEYCLLTISNVLILYEGSSVDWFVFYIFWCEVCCFWYTCLYPEKEYWFLKFYTQIYLSRVLCLIYLISK